MLILGQNDIFRGHNIVIFQYDFSNWEHGFFHCLVDSHVTEPGSSLIDPGVLSSVVSEPTRYTYAIML